MFKKEEVKDSLLDKKIQEAIDAGANDALDALCAIRREETEKRRMEWNKGFALGAATTVLGVGVGAGAVVVIGKKFIDSIE